MNIKNKAKSLIQKTVNMLGYEIQRVPNLEETMIPPAYLRSFVGTAGSPEVYEAWGEELLEYFKDLCGLKPGDDVLDVGCGCGLMAAKLAKYLDSSAIYEGFDIVPELINWCIKNISPRYLNFHFHLVEIYNKRYAPHGKSKPSDFKFPHEDASFDFVFLLSVFIHMLPRDVENYLSETSRVLRKGQRCLITYFLLNAQSLALIDAKSSAFDFTHAYGNYRTTNKSTHEDLIAHTEDYILHLYEKYGLQVVSPTLYGSWCGRKEFLSFPDIIIAVKV